jgi:hypothetical protein
MYMILLLLAILLGAAQELSCLEDTFMLGLAPNMSAVPGTSRSCYSREDCIAKLCELNDWPNVAWVIFRVG